MKKISLLTLTLLASLNLAAQQEQHIAAQQSLDIDLKEMCTDSMAQESITKQVEFCNLLENISKSQEVKPIEVKVQDEDSEPWVIRFHYGFTRTNYNPTDLHIESTPVTATIKDVKMIERTSSHWYNPKKWTSIDKAFKWIDEPSNTFTFSFEKKNNIIYLTIFHPKYLKSLRYTTKVVDGQETLHFEDMVHTEDFSTELPEGYNELYLGNTHMNMSWQVGYGHSFKVLKNRKYGQLQFIPRLDLGLATGSARSVRIVPGVAWDDHIEENKIQGYNASAGLRAEYKVGKVSAFAEYKNTFSKLNHGFYDGNIEYNLNYQTFTFGLGIDIFKFKKKNK